MRIQETDQILKESRHARNNVQQQRGGFFARSWRMFLGLFGISK